jgi:transposase
MKHKKSDEYVAYDVTSVSSYSKNITELEWGYNRDKEKLPQINIGMYFGEETKLPLYYRVYPGSISDKAHLKYMVADNDFINGQKTRFVMDRGFYSADNLRYLTERGYRFVIALPTSLKYCTELIKKYGGEVANHSEYRLGAGLPYGKSYEETASYYDGRNNAG